MKKLLIQYKEGNADCEDCGWYSWVDARIFVDGELLLETKGDGHLGGYPHNLGEVLPLILEALGYEVEFDDVQNYP